MIYLALLRDNSDFRKLWLGQLVSNAGDWFNQIAVLGLVTALTGSGLAAGLVFFVDSVPNALIAPWAGAVADRFDRKRLMIVTDLLRAGIALSLVLIDRPEQVPFIYALSALLIILSAFFYPAQQAAIPNIVRRQNLLTANAISAATWATMLALGGALGGLVSAGLGRDVAFSINAGSFLLSALLIASIRRPLAEAGDASRPRQSSLKDFAEALRYLRDHPNVAAIVPVKAGWGIGGGLLVILTLFGSKVYGLGDAGIGYFFSARGLGTFVGPFLARAAGAGSPSRMRRVIGGGFLLGGLGYILFAGVNALPLALALVVLSHIGSSALWVTSTTLLQMQAPDWVRGRVFSIEMGLMNLMLGLSALVTGWLTGVLPLRLTPLLIGGVMAAAGVLWFLMIYLRRERWAPDVAGETALSSRPAK